MRFDAVIIGGGPAGMAVACGLQEKGRKCAVVAEGLSIHDAGREGFFAAGGVLFKGDRAVRAEMEGDAVRRVYTSNLGDDALEADVFVLATGKFFGRGLVADMQKVYEPLFGLDVEYDEDRSRWFDPDFAAPQPFLDFGVKTDGAARALKGGVPVSNLYAAGEVLAGVHSASPDAVSRIAATADAVLNSIQ